MRNNLHELSPSDVSLIRQCLTAAVEGSFFPDWEFRILLGVDRETVKKVRDAWPQQTINSEEFDCAVLNSMNNLVGYPHGSNDELANFVSGELTAIQPALDRLRRLLKEIRRGEMT